MLGASSSPLSIADLDWVHTASTASPRISDNGAYPKLSIRHGCNS